LHQPAHPCHELHGRKWLEHVVVRPEAEASHHVGLLPHRGEHDDRHGGEACIPAQPVENLDDEQLEFVAQQGEPRVDLKDCTTREEKIAKLKAAGIHLSKAPGVMKEKDDGKGGKKMEKEGAGMSRRAPLCKRRTPCRR